MEGSEKELKVRRVTQDEKTNKVRVNRLTGRSNGSAQGKAEAEQTQPVRDMADSE